MPGALHTLAHLLHPSPHKARREDYYPHFTGDRNKVQRGYISHSGPHSPQTVELGFKPRAA